MRRFGLASLFAVVFVAVSCTDVPTSPIVEEVHDPVEIVVREFADLSDPDTVVFHVRAFEWEKGDTLRYDIRIEYKGLLIQQHNGAVLRDYVGFVFEHNPGVSRDWYVMAWNGADTARVEYTNASNQGVLSGVSLSVKLLASGN